MKLTTRKSEIILNSLAVTDTREIAGVLGVSADYVLKILKGFRSIKSPLAQEVMRVTFYRAKQNRDFRNTKRVA